jgi:hypothetical protein
MKRVFFAALAVCALTATTLNAQSKEPSGDPTSPEFPFPWPTPDLHDHNRAIAFASVILAGNGGHVDLWKEVNPYGYCDGSSVPGDETGKPGEGSDGSTGSNDEPTKPTCGWDVMYTTAYALVECPDGRAYITRSGEGVVLSSPTEGATYEWTEAVGCADGPISDGLNKARPIDRKHLRKAALR